MEIFPERVQKLWNKWELRVMVLLSLSIQIILIFFGKWRKYSAKNWVRIILWLAYLSADWVATVSLGILANSQGDSSNNDPNDVLIAFWAPFLLLHLGGPDTITAYSLEDNELWLRHLLGLLVQVWVAFYVFLRSWTDNRLSILAIPMFVPGIIKYGERTWVLRSASSEHFRDSLFNPPNLDPNYIKLVGECITKKAEGGGVAVEIASNVGPHSDTKFLPVAYHFFQMFKRLFADLIISPEDVGISQHIFVESNWEDAFKIIEIELGLMYDVLYTKASIIYTTVGCVLRSISLSSTISLFLAFLIIEKHGYSSIDIIITHILLVGAIVLEMYAVIVLLSSDWAILWLSEHKSKSSFVNPIFRLISAFRLTSNKRWSNSVAQFSVLSFCLKDKSTHGFQKLYRISEKLETYRYTNLEEVSRDSKRLIFQYLQEKSKTLEYSQIRTLGVGGVVQNESVPDQLDWAICLEFNQSILLWHIATDICYYSDPNKSSKREMSKLVSDYMAYLLVTCPFMLPSGFMVPGPEGSQAESVGLPNGIGQIMFQDTCTQAMQYLERKPISEACSMLLGSPPDDRVRSSNSVLFASSKLAKFLQRLETKWEIMSDMWLAMLFFAASKCRGNYHAQRIGRGGELLSHVWLLMAHLGFTEQFRIEPVEDFSDEEY